MRQISVYLLFFGALTLLFTQCTRDKSFPPSPDNDTTSTKTLCDTVGLSYQDEIEPVMSANCAISSCHGNGSSQGGISLETYSEVKDAANNDPFLCAIKHQSGCTNMPQGSDQLPDSTIQTIDCWVDNGTPKN